MFCRNCGKEIDANAAVCTKYGVQLNTIVKSEQKSKLIASLLGIFLGCLDIHSFYLGRIGIGVIQIVVTLITCGAGALWRFIEGILIPCGKIDKDAKGIPLAN
ncbi:MAG: TM2 domain-containing protein [Candidatus Ornithomonoglobus sp.]